MRRAPIFMDQDEFEIFRVGNDSPQPTAPTPSPAAESPAPESTTDALSSTNREGLSALQEMVDGSLSAIQPRLLIIDDDPGLRESIEITLRSRYDLTMCSSGSEGVREMNSDIFCVILDIKMTGMDGFETFRQLKDEYPDVPIIFHSAYQDLKNPLEIMNDYRPFAYVKKGTSFAELMATIHSAVEHSRQIMKNAILISELERMAMSYARFVPTQFLKYLDRNSINDVALGDSIQKDMTVMFTDIRRFTAMSETMTPRENFDFINHYLGRVGPAIRENNGFIDKYIGDAVMALFPEEPDDALRAAIAVMLQLNQYNDERAEQGRAALEIGIGIHTGNLMLGIIGEEERMEGTVISDAVNLASRMEGVSKLYGAPVTISGPTLFRLDDPTVYSFRFLGVIPIKGKKDPVSIYEVFDGDPTERRQLKLDSRYNFEKGIHAYLNQDFARAADIFQEILNDNPGDSSAQYIFERSRYYERHGVPLDWVDVKVTAGAAGD